MSQELLSTAQVAETLGCSIRTVHRLVRREDLAPVQKMPGESGAYLFDAAAVRAYAKQRAA